MTVQSATMEEPTPAPALSPRELAILRTVAASASEGLTTTEIGKELKDYKERVPESQPAAIWSSSALMPSRTGTALLLAAAKGALRSGST